MARPKIAVFISGSGTNLQALIDASKKGKLQADIALVVSNRTNAFGLQRAKDSSISTKTLILKEYKLAGKTRAEYDFDLMQLVKTAFEGESPDLIVLAGFMHILSAEFISAFNPGSIINLHPALPGCFEGTRAIERAFESFQRGEIKHTGVMIHKCIPEVDRGEVIVQQVCPILAEDTIETLENRIHAIEHELIVQGTELSLMVIPIK